MKLSLCLLRFAEFQNKVLISDRGWCFYLMSRTSAVACLSVPLTSSFWVPPHASLPSGGPQCAERSTTSPHLHIHLWADWNKSELLSGPRPPCNWILPCFTECNKAWHWMEGKYTQHLETNPGHACSTTNRGSGYCLVSFTDTVLPSK